MKHLLTAETLLGPETLTNYLRISVAAYDNGFDDQVLVYVS